MNANNVINDDLTLDEKLAAIDAAMKVEMVKVNRDRGRPIDTPIDPAGLTICEGCE